MGVPDDDSTNIDAPNKFSVTAHPDVQRIQILAPIPHTLTANDALNLAQWLIHAATQLTKL